MANESVRNSQDDFSQAVTGGQPYPVLTIPIRVDDEGGQSGSSATSDGENGGTGMGRLVSGALRELLGWNPNLDDPRGFETALSQTIDLEDFEGHVRYKVKPRSFSVLTSLEGGVTGAQASVHERTRRAVDEALVLLDILYPLSNTADAQDVVAIKALVKQHLQQLVSELGRLGGPRVRKVDQLFDLLLAPEKTTVTSGSTNKPNPGARNGGNGAWGDGVAGEIGNLRDQLGLKFNRVNTVDEEENLTKYRLLSDYVTDLRSTWKTNRRFFTRGTTGAPFFGTQLVHLSRMLTVIAEQVREVRFAFNSVFIGPRERQTIEVIPRWALPDASAKTDTSGPASAYAPREWVAFIQDQEKAKKSQEAEPIYIEDALSWIEGFAREEGPTLIREAGKLGVEHAFVPVATGLKYLVAGVRYPKNIDLLPAGYQTLRIEHALFELEKQFDSLLHAASGLRHEPEPAFIEESRPPSGSPAGGAGSAPPNGKQT